MLKVPATCLVLCLLLNAVHAQNVDSLVIHLKRGGIKKIALADIRLVLVDSVTNMAVKPIRQNSGDVIVVPTPATDRCYFRVHGMTQRPRSAIIFDALGQLVRDLKFGDGDSSWDCRDNLGTSVRSGVYRAVLYFTEHSTSVNIVIER